MNITQESTGDLTATIKMELNPEDYSEKVKQSLKELQRKANMPGFRPGKVPFGMIKKMYGKSAIAEEINKIITDSLNDYIKENKLDILGYPIGNREKGMEIDFEQEGDYEFYFDIGLVPEVNLELSDNIGVDYYEIKVEDEKIDMYQDDARKRFGTPVNPDTIANGDVVNGDFIQLDNDGNLLEEGVTNSAPIHLDFIKDEKVKEEFLGSKKEDKIRFNPLKATGNETETASMLGIKKDETDKLESDYEFAITEITRIEPAKIDKELYQKVYPKDNIEDEKQFRKRIGEEASGYYQRESDNYFMHSAIEKFINETEINLPDDFMKKWLVESNEKLTEEGVNKDYDNYAKSLKQQLIIGKISKDNNIEVDDKDIKEHVKKSFASHYMIDIEDEEKFKQLDTIADSIMQNKEEVNKIYDEILDNRMRELFKSKLKLIKKEISYNDFIKLVDEHNKNHNHEH
ncbi:MAG: trigger factor [Bacteroidales bacterium]|nr:trigger factor [Bacteroidales bacterium]